MPAGWCVTCKRFFLTFPTSSPFAPSPPARPPPWFFSHLHMPRSWRPQASAPAGSAGMVPPPPDGAWPRPRHLQVFAQTLFPCGPPGLFHLEFQPLPGSPSTCQSSCVRYRVLSYWFLVALLQLKCDLDREFCLFCSGPIPRPDGKAPGHINKRCKQSWSDRGPGTIVLLIFSYFSYISLSVRMEKAGLAPARSSFAHPSVFTTEDLIDKKKTRRRDRGWPEGATADQFLAGGLRTAGRVLLPRVRVRWEGCRHFSSGGAYALPAPLPSLTLDWAGKAPRFQAGARTLTYESGPCSGHFLPPRVWWLWVGQGGRRQMQREAQGAWPVYHAGQTQADISASCPSQRKAWLTAGHRLSHPRPPGWSTRSPVTHDLDVLKSYSPSLPAFQKVV